MEPCYIPFDIDNWRSIPAIEERVATQGDLNDCVAVFATGAGQSEVVTNPGLPALATLKNEDGTTETVVIVQIEKQIGGPLTVVGYILPSGGNGIGTLPEFNIIEYSKD
ncbi:hypothetical protein EI545_01660 [Tabrizicola piscis]|uniref:Uncharacterized protein n=1 Tax=Tabrizicola piscis TaxID=2494374 RepID=A0A3S8U228_9RHOB|nr:hypothetical protein [Tabrizicola piscis]AZL57662.1 hypothetical protein EI545_01660 [Tabrizicola piscis]